MSDAGAKRPELLVVDGSRLIRHACTAHGESLGLTVVTVESLGPALDAIATRRPTAIVTSLELADLPGTSLVAALRASPRHRAIPVAIMTASSPSHTSLSSIEVDGVLLKDATLLERLTKFLKSMDVPLGKPQSGAPKEHETLDIRVLIAEDSKTNSAIIGRMLHVAGADVVCALHGGEAVAEVEQRPFDIILMDIEMPVMDGREATRTLRAAGVSTPIIAVTGHDPESFADEARECGFDDILEKPMKRAQLIEMCQRHTVAKTG